MSRQGPIASGASFVKPLRLKLRPRKRELALRRLSPLRDGEGSRER